MVKEVRLVRNREGRSKGFGYIEYITEVSTFIIYLGWALIRVVNDV